MRGRRDLPGRGKRRARTGLVARVGLAASESTRALATDEAKNRAGSEAAADGHGTRECTDRPSLRASLMNVRPSLFAIFFLGCAAVSPTPNAVTPQPSPSSPPQAESSEVHSQSSLSRSTLGGTTWAFCGGSTTSVRFLDDGHTRLSDSARRPQGRGNCGGQWSDDGIGNVRFDCNNFTIYEVHLDSDRMTGRWYRNAAQKYDPRLRGIAPGGLTCLNRVAGTQTQAAPVISDEMARCLDILDGLRSALAPEKHVRLQLAAWKCPTAEVLDALQPPPGPRADNDPICTSLLAGMRASHFPEKDIGIHLAANNCPPPPSQVDPNDAGPERD
jgi:hypothetical protein